MSSEKLEPIDGALKIARFACACPHYPGGLDSQFASCSCAKLCDVVTAEIDALVRTSLSACEAKLAASEKRCGELEARVKVLECGSSL
jgi:hypothetical protein